MRCWYSILTDRAAAVACSCVCATTMATCWPWCRMRLSLKGVGGLGPSGVIGPSASAGAFLCVTTVSTPGDASASSMSIRLIVPAAIVDCTSAACARPSKEKSDGYGAAPVTFSGPSTRSTPAPTIVLLSAVVTAGFPRSSAGFARSFAWRARP